MVAGVASSKWWPLTQQRLKDRCQSRSSLPGIWNASWDFSSVQSLSRVRLFVTPWTAAHQASLSITNSWSLLKLMSITLVMPFNHLILFIPFSSCLQSFLASGSYPVSQFFASGGQSTGVSASASVLPMNIQDWFFRMEWLDLPAVQGTLKSSTPQFKSINSVLSFLYSLNSL